MDNDHKSIEERRKQKTKKKKLGNVYPPYFSGIASGAANDALT